MVKHAMQADYRRQSLSSLKYDLCSSPERFGKKCRPGPVLATYVKSVLPEHVPAYEKHENALARI